MTPEEMLKRITIKVTPVVIGPSRALVVQAAGNYAPSELLYQEQSRELERGICPTCGDKVETTIGESYVTFKCVKNPVFHEWRRTKSFLFSD